MGDFEQLFDDPSLKEAVRTLRGGHRASPRLRSRVQNQIAGLRDEEENRSEHRQNWRWIAAVAAIVLIAVGVSNYLSSEDQPSPGHHSNSKPYSRNDTLLSAMVNAHDRGTDQAGDQGALTAPLTDPAALATEASKTLGRVVPVPSFAAGGWKLDAARLCKVYYDTAVRFHFTRGGEAMTVVSLPSSAWEGGTEGQHYELFSGKNAIAGYVHKGSLTCVVGDPSMTQADVTALRDHLMSGGT